MSLIPSSSKEVMVKLFNRALMALALLGLAGAAQARPNVSMGGGTCDASIASVGLKAPAQAAVLPRLSEIIDRRIELLPSSGGFCFAAQNDLGPLRAATFTTNIELGTLEILDGSVLTRLHVNEQLNRVTLFGGVIRNPVVFIRVVATSRTRVFAVIRRVRTHPHAASE